MWMRVVVAIILLLLPASAFAQMDKHIALLIGNRAYDGSVGVLKNPHNDIALVGEALADRASRYCLRLRMRGAALSSVVCVSWFGGSTQPRRRHRLPLLFGTWRGREGHQYQLPNPD